MSPYIVYFKPKAVEIIAADEPWEGDDVVQIMGGYVVQVRADNYRLALEKAQALVRKWKERYGCPTY